MYVGYTLLCNGRFTCRRATGRRIIVTNKQARITRQAEQFFNGTIQYMSVTTRKITSCRTDIRHKNSISDKQGVAYQIRYTGRRVTGSMKDLYWKLPYVQTFIMVE